MDKTKSRPEKRCKLNEKTKIISTNLNTAIKILHQNIQSIYNAIAKIEALLEDLDECHVLGLTEHWQSTNKLETIKLKKLNLITSYCRQEGEHGGFALYAGENISAIALNVSIINT